MDELTREFRTRLHERAEALVADRAALDRDPAARARVRAAAHALKGSGGTYGFPEISLAAAAVEGASDAELGARLEALLGVMAREGAAPSAAGRGLASVLEEPLGDFRDAVAGRRGGRPAAGASLLIVDDDPDIAQLLARVLAAPGREIRVAGTAASALELSGEAPSDLIVLDLGLPDADGRTLLSTFRERPETSTTPVVVLSAVHSGAARTECFALGADAYVEKPFDPADVAATIATMLERAAQVRRVERVDALTALPDRAAFREACARAAARRASVPTSLALLELDQYRSLASSQGWGSAACALAGAARLLARALPGAASLARWTGGTCAVLLVDADEAAASATVAGALRAVRAAASAEGPGPVWTFSAGVAQWAAGMPLEEAVAEAERQLVAARAAGGDAARSEAARAPAPRQVVLLAEDDDLIASVVKHRLEREGITVKHFTDGAAAAAAAPALRPTLAILDVKMPAMDGFELLGRLRQERGLAGMPIMMLTSMGSEQDVVRGLQLGADDYVVKPFSPVELVARVHRLLARA